MDFKREACDSKCLQINCDDIYCPPTKLWEGNVFTHVCLPVCSQGVPNLTITHDALDVTVHSIPSPTTSARHQTWYPLHRHQTWETLPSPSPRLATSDGHHWRPVQTCSFENPPLGVTSGGRYWSTYSWHKQAVRILLGCLLVIFCILPVQNHKFYWI